MQYSLTFEPKKSILRDFAFQPTALLFPTYILIVEEGLNVGVKPVTIVVNGEVVQYRHLSKSQKQRPIYQVFTQDDDFCLNSFFTLDRNLDDIVSWLNRDIETDFINPNYYPKVPYTNEDIRFVNSHEIYGYYSMNKTKFMSYWKRGLKSLQELDTESLKFKPQFDLSIWSEFGARHNKGLITITTDTDFTYAMSAGVILAKESNERITVRHLQSTLKVKDELAQSNYLQNVDWYNSLGLELVESNLQVFGVQLTEEQMLPLLEVNEQKIMLPKDIIFSDESYKKLKQLFINADAVYNNGSFEFDTSEEAIEMFNELLAGKIINIKKSLQYYPTTELASKEFLNGLDFKGLTVFEPTAGDGFLVRKAYELGAKDVLCAEIYKKFHPSLIESKGTIIGEDVFSITKEQLKGIDAVLANPPFTSGLDIKVINHILDIVEPDVPVYTILSAKVDQSDEKSYQDFKAKLQSHGLEIKKIEKGAFKESGTNISCVYVHITSRNEKVINAA